MLDPLEAIMESAFAELGGIVGRSNRLPPDAWLSKAEMLDVRQTDEPESTATAIPESFGIKSYGTGTVTLYSGWVNHMGRSNTEVAEATVAVTGASAVAPSYITIRVTKSSGSAEIIDLAANPVADDGTYMFRVLYEAYVTDDVVTISKDRRTDWSMGSPM